MLFHHDERTGAGSLACQQKDQLYVRHTEKMEMGAGRYWEDFEYLTGA